MARATTFIIVVAIIVQSSTTLIMAAAAAHHEEDGRNWRSAISVSCDSEEFYGKGSLEAKMVKELVEDLEVRTQSALSGYWGNYRPLYLPFVWGFATCTGHLTNSTGCSHCIAQAFKNALDVCETAMGSTSHLPFCALKYEFYPFWVMDALANKTIVI